MLCCADSERTAVGLLDRLRVAMPDRTSFTLLRALPPPPPWVPGLLAAVGCALPPEDDQPDCFPTTPGIPEVIVRAPAAEAAAAACSELRPDLIVVGWHHHVLPLPGRWLHPTAWRLSRSSPSDVLLVPLDG